MHVATLAHFFSSFKGLGGVEAVLRQHHAHDAKCGLNSDFVIYASREGNYGANVHFLDLDNSTTTIRQAQKTLHGLFSGRPAHVSVYHNVSTMRSFLCGEDQASRRVLMLHGIGFGIGADLRRRRRWLDGVICVNEQSRAAAERCLPHLDPSRFLILPLPISPCPFEPQHPPMDGRPIIIAYAGRLMREHKRVDRLPDLCAELERRRISYRMAILGDGPEDQWLRGRLAGNANVLFHGRLTGNAYWHALAACDVILYVSDTEGQPLALLEGMCAGLLPLFPRVGSAGDHYTETVAVDLLYSPGSMPEAAQAIARLAATPEVEVARMRARSRQSVSKHFTGEYFAEFSKFIHHLLASPRISKNHVGWLMPGLDSVPLRWLATASVIRHRLRQAVTCRR